MLILTQHSTPKMGPLHFLSGAMSLFALWQTEVGSPTSHFPSVFFRSYHQSIEQAITRIPRDFSSKNRDWTEDSLQDSLGNSTWDDYTVIIGMIIGIVFWFLWVNHPCPLSCHMEYPPNQNPGGLTLMYSLWGLLWGRTYVYQNHSKSRGIFILKNLWISHVKS